MSRAHLPALDAVRGLAVVLVFLGHAANDGLLPGWLGGGSGQMGVQLFFLLSGCLMMRLYASQAPDREGMRAFAAARAGRILPLYLVTVGASAATWAAGGTAHYRLDDLPGIAAAALFVEAPQELWSIPVEVQFYALFLILWPWLNRAGPAALVLAVAAAFALAVAWRGLLSEAMVLPPYLPVFLAGCLIGRLPPGPGVPAIVAVALFALNLPGLRGFEFWGGFYPAHWLDPLRLGAAALVLWSALQVRGRWLGPAQPALAALGRISFCIYLIHRPVLRALAGAVDLPGPALAALAAAVCIALGALSLSLFERPAARAIRGLGRRPRPAPRPGKA